VLSAYADLNFLALETSDSAFVIYARPVLGDLEARPHEFARAYNIPQLAGADYAKHWVSVDAMEGFHLREIHYHSNPDLSRWLLFESLRRHLSQHDVSGDNVDDASSRFSRELRLPMQRHAEGIEELILQPYFLYAKRKLGLLADFHFRLAEGASFSRRVQQLSLSLDRNLRRNLDYYADRAGRIAKFVDQRWSALRTFPLLSDRREVRLSKQFERLNAERLHAKSYLFSAQQVEKNPYAGLRQLGPLRAPNEPTILTFVFRESERTAARRLAMAIRGNPRDRSPYPGYTPLFRTPLEIDAHPVVLSGFDDADIRTAIDALHAKDRSVLPVLVLPEKQKDIYFKFKALSSGRHIASQVCTSTIINDEHALKWSVANIALQLFCKAGGLPWKVQPTEEQSLIIGISQSHKEACDGERRRIERHFAFSVLTDSSGLFKQIEVLGNSTDRQAYLTQLAANVERLMRESLPNVKRVVLHTSFRLRRDEMKRIRDAVNSVASDENARTVQFAVVKINDKSRFFATNPQANSLVPVEGTFIRLGRSEFLIWFEGILPPKNTVTKAFPGPTHVEVVRVDTADRIDEIILLQDLANLSGANWRGFNARSIPVSVLYCKLVADFVQEFHDRNLAAPDIGDMRPWFL
jgi:hypothetical protein